MHISPINDQELSRTQSQVFIQSHGMIPASQQISRARAQLCGRLVPWFKHVIFKTWASSVAYGIYNLQKVAREGQRKAEGIQPWNVGLLLSIWHNTPNYKVYQ
jgi:hypothetical protein